MAERFSSLKACQGSPFRRPPKAAAPYRAVLDKLSGMKKKSPACEQGRNSEVGDERKRYDLIITQ
jgi:hypothetical protein